MTEPKVYKYPDEFPEKFVRWHERNYCVYQGILSHAHALKRAGHVNVGMRYLFEHQRYCGEPREDNPDVLFGLNNNFSTWYGRLIESTEPQLEGFLRMRRTEDEMAEAQAGQTEMEFD